MYARLLMALVLLFAYSSMALGITITNEPDNFRGIPWGEKVENIAGLKKIEEGGDSAFYVREGEKLTIGDAKLDKIVYGFYKNEFYVVLIEFKGSLNFSALLATFKNRYGPGGQANKYIESYVWNGEWLGILFRYNEIAQSGRVVMSYKPVEQKKRADDASAAQKGAQDL